MRTNGCTMTYGKGGVGTCARHQAMAREVCEPHVRRGPQVRVFKYAGAMRKHGGDQHMHPDGLRTTLDAIAGRKTEPCNALGVLIRRKSR